jgi:organic radical activating enzyme
MKERTIEVTSYCPFECSFCSSDATKDYDVATHMSFDTFRWELEAAKEEGIELIHLSGGEPLLHGEISYLLALLHEMFGWDYIIHTNMIPNLAYNPHVLPGVRVLTYLNVADSDEVHVLKRVLQGREARQPAVHCSRNWRENCACDHVVVRPDGTHTRAPCRKEEPHGC